MSIEEQAKDIVLGQRIKALENARNAWLEKHNIPKVKPPLHPLYGRRLNRDNYQDKD